MSSPDPSVITGITAVAGTLVGGLTSFATSYLTQRRQGHAERVLKSVERREDLYAKFNEVASKLTLDALQCSLDHPKKLIAIATLAGRIRMESSAEVLHAAEAVIEHLIETYQRPAVDPREVIRPGSRDFLAPLTRFTEACRHERLEMLRGI